MRIEDGPLAAEKKYPLEPFQTMPPQVAADGFLQTIRQLLVELEPKVSAPAPAAKSPPEPAAPAPAKKPPGWYMKEKAARLKAEKEKAAAIGNPLTPPT